MLMEQWGLINELNAFFYLQDFEKMILKKPSVA